MITELFSSTKIFLQNLISYSLFEYYTHIKNMWKNLIINSLIPQKDI